MSTSIPGGIKESINKEYLKLFPLETLLDEMFIPLNRQDNAIFVGIVNASNRDKRNAILTKVILATRLRPKVISLTRPQFDSIIEHCKKNLGLKSTIESQPSDKVFESPSDNSIFESPSDTASNEIMFETHYTQPESSPPPAAPETETTPQAIEFQSAPEPTIEFPPPPVEPPKEIKKIRKRLGEQLIDDGLINQEQLERALEESKRTNTPIGSALVKLGFIAIDQLRNALSEQQGINHLEGKDLKLSANVLCLLPEDFVRYNRVIPVSSDGRNIVVGMVNPNDKQVLNDIIYLTGLQPKPLLLTHIEYEKTLKNYFESKAGTEKLLEEISLDDQNSEAEDENIWDQVERELNDDTNLVAKFASSIIAEAIDKKASDIHIEPRLDKYVVRYRVDGILRQVLVVPQKIEGMLVSRLKVISRMDISEHRRPQDGHFSLKYGDRVYDLRLNTLPMLGKEKMVIRVLQPDLKVTKEDKERRIELVGATTEDIQKINIMTKSPHGIIFVTGPTGSGKTTTLYSILNKLNSDSVNITTVEDPVEIKIDGINQVQVNAKADITFASCLRAILRQDPDVIMIGEIRDTETIEAAIHAALTGHLVLCTLHTNSATATITRLVEMGVATHLLATAVVGIVAQRLLRKLCPGCKEKYVPELYELGLILSQPEDFDVFRENNIYRAKGCENCNGSGYIGRLGIYEIMPVNRDLKKVLSQSCASYEIEEVAISTGMKTLQRAGLDGILNGHTTIDEYLRVLGTVSD